MQPARAAPGPIGVMPGVFLRFEPTADPVPLVVDVSRSGREYPQEFRSPLPFSVLHENVSMHLEKLWGGAPDVGGTMLYCCFPNTWIDVNRSLQDMDPGAVQDGWPAPLKPTNRTLKGLGLIKTRSRYGELLQERPLLRAEVETRLRDYYEPYHAELLRIIEATHARFGRVRHMSVHCMPPVGGPADDDAGARRPDFCLGNLDGVTCSADLTGALRDWIGEMGYTVTVNEPFRGNETIRRHGNPQAGVESIQVELNKKLFVDNSTFRPTEGLEPLQHDLVTLMHRFAAWRR
ncbi:MAG: N-formylglutamate amidohydrolase [Ramlibacter sp.]|nr:N-formylglutamate amidohydrolase [Ramlibacter sp.]